MVGAHKDGGAEEECEEVSDSLKLTAKLAQENELLLERSLQSSRKVQVIPHMNLFLRRG